MLVSLPTILARSRRNKQAVACFSVTSPQLVDSVAVAANRKKGKAVIVLEFESLRDYHLSAMTGYALNVTHASAGDLSVVIRVAAQREEILAALETGIPGLWLKRANHMSETEYITICQWTLKQAYRHGCSLVGECGDPVLPQAPEVLAESYGVAALAVMPWIERDGYAVIDRHQLSEVVRRAKVPLISLQTPQTGKQRLICAQEGISGWYVPSAVLNEPFTAGLYTGLRDHSQTDPAVYQRYALTAAQEAASHYI